MNFVPAVTACNRNEPLDAFAGDKFREAIALLSITDSLELQLDELGGGDGGSKRNDNLESKKTLNLYGNYYGKTKKR